MHFVRRASILAAVVLCSSSALRAETLADLAPALGYNKACAYSADSRTFAIASPNLLVFDAQTHRLRKSINIGNFSAMAVALSPDGRIAAVSTADLESPNKPTLVGEQLVIVDLAAGKVINRFAGMSEGYNLHRRISISPDAKLVATSNAEGINVYDIATGKTIWEYRQDRKINPTGSYAAAAVTPDWRFFFHNLQRISYPARETTAPLVYEPNEKSQFHWDNLISADGSKAAIAGGPNGTVQRVFTLSDGNLVAECLKLSTVMFDGNRDLTTLYTGRGYWSGDKIVSIDLGALSRASARPDGGEVTNGESYFALKPGTTGVLTQKLAWAALGSLPIEVGAKASVWNYGQFSIDLATQSFALLPKKPFDFNDDLRTSYGDFTKVYSTDKLTRIDGTGKVFKRSDTKANFPDQPTSDLFASVTPKPEYPGCQPCYLSNELVAMVTPDKLHIVVLATGKIVNSFPYAPHAIETTDYKGDPTKVTPRYAGLASMLTGKRLLVDQGSWDTCFRHYVRLFDTATGKQVGETLMIPKFGGIAHQPVVAPNGRLAALVADKRVFLLDAETGKSLQPLTAENMVVSAAFSADSSQLALATSSTLEIFSVQTGKRTTTVAVRYNMPPSPENAGIAFFGPDGRLTKALGKKDALFLKP